MANVTTSSETNGITPLFDGYEVAPFRNWSRRKNSGGIFCGTCRHRIPSRMHSDPPVPKYPHCPWCGAKVAERIRKAVEHG